MTRLNWAIAWVLEKLGRDIWKVRFRLRAIQGETEAASGRARSGDPTTAAAGRDRLRELEQQTFWEFDRLAHYTGSLLIERAALMHIEVPARPATQGQENESWRISSFTGLYVLTDRGIAFVRDRVRAEERQQRDDFLAWAPAVTGFFSALAGLGGVLIALATTLRWGQP